MRDKILWMVFSKAEALYVGKISDVIRRDFSLEVVLCTAYQSTADALHQAGCPCLTLEELLRTIGNGEGDTDQLIRNANQLLSRIDINMLLHGDALFYLFGDHQSARVLIARTVLALHQHLLQGNYRACLRYPTGSAVGRALSILAEELTIPSFSLYNCFNIETSGLVPAGLEEQWRWVTFERTAGTWRSEAITDADRNEIDQFVKTYVDAHRSSPRVLLKKKKPEQGWWSRLRSNILAHLSTSAPEAVVPYVPGKYWQAGNLDPLLHAWKCYLRNIKDKWIETYPTFRYDKVPKQYIYMPLIAPWDASHRALNPMNYLQEYIIRIVNESLPYGYQLVIKEHPYSLGDLSHHKLRGLQRLGVQVVDPHTHNLELIQNAHAVICPGETSGWETVLLKIPLIVFGAQPYYTDCPGVQTLTDPNAVPRALLDAVRSRSTQTTNQNQWYAFIQRVFRTSSRSNIWGYRQFLWSGENKSNDNIRALAIMIVETLQTLPHDPCKSAVA